MKSVWCFCQLSLAAALPDPHFHRKIITIFGVCLAAHKLCLHSSQHRWDFCKTYTLNSKDYFICARREPNNFLTLVVKVSPNSSTTAFSTNYTFLPPHQSPSISDDQLQDKAEGQPFCTFAHFCVNFCTGVKVTVMVFGPESRAKASSVFPLKREHLARHQAPELLKAMELGKAELIPSQASHPLTKNLGKAQIQTWSLGTICVKATKCKLATKGALNTQQISQMGIPSIIIFNFPFPNIQIPKNTSKHTRLWRKQLSKE